MKKFILTLVMTLMAVSAFAQYNDKYINDMIWDGQENFLVNKYMKGHKQIASGGVILTSTIVFDAIYYGVLAEFSTREDSNPDSIYIASIVGGAFTCVGVIASLCQFWAGGSNIRKAQSMVRLGRDGALYITFPDRRYR